MVIFALLFLFYIHITCSGKIIHSLQIRRSGWYSKWNKQPQSFGSRISFSPFLPSILTKSCYCLKKTNKQKKNLLQSDEIEVFKILNKFFSYASSQVLTWLFWILSCALFLPHLFLHLQTYLLTETCTHTHSCKLLQDREYILFVFLLYHSSGNLSTKNIWWDEWDDPKLKAITVKPELYRGEAHKIDVCMNAVNYMGLNGHTVWGRSSLGLYWWIWCMVGLSWENLFVMGGLSWFK